MVEIANFVLNCLVFIILYGSIRRFMWKQTGNSPAPRFLTRAWDSTVDFFMTAVKERQGDIRKILWTLIEAEFCTPEDGVEDIMLSSKITFKLRSC